MGRGRRRPDAAAHDNKCMRKTMQACGRSGSGRFGQTIHAGVSGCVGFGLKNPRAGPGRVIIFRPIENSTVEYVVSLFLM